MSRSARRRSATSSQAVLPDRPVGLFEERRHLRGRPLLALELDGHRADDLLVLLFQLGQRGLAGDVGLAVEGPAVLLGAVEDAVAVAREAGAVGRVEVLLADRVLDAA